MATEGVYPMGDSDDPIGRGLTVGKKFGWLCQFVPLGGGAMRRIYFMLFIAILVVAPAFSAQAVTITDNNDEMHLYQIVANQAFGSLTGYASSQDFANAFPILESLPATVGDAYYVVTAYANFASFTQDPGTYLTASPNTLVKLGTPFPVGADGIFSPAPIAFQASSDIGFFDQTSGGGTKYTQLALNPGHPAQSNGLIFKIADDHFIVAFEDGGWDQPLGDKDYNDLVLNVTTSHAPIPGSLILLGSGLLGLVGLRRSKKI
jgi:hypothetical protein